MTCRHCGTTISPFLAFSQPVEGGMAYAQLCPRCHRILGLRPRLQGDPPQIPAVFNRHEVKRLEFVRWRLASECAAQTKIARPFSAEAA
jgi:hypothetical protein